MRAREANSYFCRKVDATDAWNIALDRIKVVAKKSSEDTKPKLNIKVLLGKNPSFPMSTIEKEIQRGLNVNAIDANTDETLLMYAAHHGSLSLAKIMHKNLANLEAVNSKGENAFLIA